MKLDNQRVLMILKEPTIPRVELNTVHLYQHYSLFMHNELQYTGRGDYDESVQPAKHSVLNQKFELRPSWNNIHDTFPTGTAQDTTKGPMFRNVGNQVSTYAGKHPRTVKTFETLVMAGKPHGVFVEFNLLCLH